MPNEIYSFFIPSAWKTSDQDQIPTGVLETTYDSTRIEEIN